MHNASNQQKIIKNKNTKNLHHRKMLRSMHVPMRSSISDQISVITGMSVI